MELGRPAIASWARRSRPSPAQALILVGVSGVAICLVLIVLMGQARVVGQGNFVGYAVVQKLDVFGYTIYRDPVRAGLVDIANGILLMSIATVSAFTCVLLSGTRRWSAGFAFFLLVAVGAVYLAADEILSIHETLGHNLRALAELPGIDHPDDAIIALYAVPSAVFAYRFRALIASSGVALGLLATGGALFVASSAMDINAVTGEEYVEPIATLMLLAGFCILAIVELRRRVLRSPSASDALS